MIGDHTPFHDPIDVLPGTLVLGKVFHKYGPPRTWLIVGQSTYVLAHEMIKYVSGLLTMGQSAKFIETMLVSRADVAAGNVIFFEPEKRSSKRTIYSQHGNRR